MFSKLFRNALFVVAAFATFSSSASIISLTANGNAAGALDLNGSYASFDDFFFNGTAEPATGFEVGNEVVMFFAELNNEIALITTISGPSSIRGKLTMDFTPTSGTFSIYDDLVDLVSPVLAVHKTGVNSGDGFVFESLAGTLDLVVDFSGQLNMELLTFLTFDSSGSSSTLFTSDLTTDPSVTLFGSVSTPPTVQVGAPSILAILALGLFALSLRRKH